MPTGREQWFAELLTAGLETKVLAEPDVMTHVTPAVLAASVPRDVMVQLFESALASGSMSPTAVLATATPALLGQHIKHDLLWTCLAQAAQRAGMDGSAPLTDEGREFLRRSLDSALRNQVVAPKDVVAEVNAKVLGHFPDALTSKLLEASLTAGKMTPELVIETIGVTDIAKHAPSNVVWASLAKAANSAPTATAAAPPSATETPRPTTTTPPVTSATVSAASGSTESGPRTVKIPPARNPTPSKPAIELLDDDDVASVLVDLDEVPTENSVMKPLPAAPAADDKIKRGLFGREKRT